MDGPGTVPSRENLSIGDRVAGEDGITGDRVVGELVEKGSRLDFVSVLRPGRFGTASLLSPDSGENRRTRMIPGNGKG